VGNGEPRVTRWRGRVHNGGGGGLAPRGEGPVWITSGTVQGNSQYMAGRVPRKRMTAIQRAVI
jgi:hypothetical protein